MAVKIFCNSCQKFIKEASKKEFSDLTGSEICENCEQKVADALKDIEKTANRAIVQIQTTLGKAKSDIEELMRRVVRGNSGTDL